VNFDGAIRHDSNHCEVIALPLSIGVDPQVLINALTVQVDTGTKMSGYPTNQMG